MIPNLLTHTGVLISLGLLGGCALVLTAVAFLMARAKLSLRPIWWFAGFILIIVLPQLGYHVYDAITFERKSAPVLAAIRASDHGDLTSRQALEAIFGPDVDPALVADVRSSFGDVFADAEFARFALFPSGETALFARFRSERSAEQAWIAYLAVSGLKGVVDGNSQRGFSGTRPAGDRVFVLPMRTMLGIWTGPDEAAIQARRAGFSIAPNEEPPLNVMLPLLVAILGIAVVYFFKGSAWAATLPREPVDPLAAEQLAARLLAVNTLDAPFQVSSKPDSNQIEVTWRYADARWLDASRTHGMRRTHRILLSLDEQEHVVRATDFSGSFDWSAGAGGGNLKWRAQTGITFFEYRRQRVFGLQITPDGRLTPNMRYSYTFSLQEMKAPFIAAVTQAGWDWRPVLWQNPPGWLRWLTG